MAKGVVAERDHVGADREQILGGLLSDPEPSGGVLAVDDHQVGAVTLAQVGHRATEARPPGLADDVGDEQDPHRAGG